MMPPPGAPRPRSEADGSNRLRNCAGSFVVSHLPTLTAHRRNIPPKRTQTASSVQVVEAVAGQVAQGTQYAYLVARRGRRRDGNRANKRGEP